MRVASRRRLRDFWETNQQAEGPLRAWFDEAKRAFWSTPQDVKNAYASDSIIVDNRVVFNIGGNRYRLFVHVRYVLGIVLIKFVGTHAEYDKIDAETV